MSAFPGPMLAPPAAGYWPSIREFAARGGFANGLIPTIAGNVWYVNTNTSQPSLRQGAQGSDGNSGLSPFAPFATVAKAFTVVQSYDIIVIDGVIREQVSTPAGIYDVTIVGAANRPRQATDNGVPTGGGACWLSPTSPTALTPLLKIRNQGWTVRNILFAPVASSSCIQFFRDATYDASHATIEGCRFVAGGASSIGIEDVGGCYNTLIQNNEFESLATAIQTTSTGIAVPLKNRILSNIFSNNTNSINVSYTQGVIMGNVFRQAANDTNIKISVVAVAGQGSLNMVLYNTFSDAAANVTIAKGYKPGTTDVWRNYVTDTAAFIVAVPA